jgi:hypothetical protein
VRIRPVSAEFYAGGWADMTKLTVAFRNFANVLKVHDLLRLSLAAQLQRSG